MTKMYIKIFGVLSFLFCVHFVTPNLLPFLNEPDSEIRLCIADVVKKTSCQGKVMEESLELLRSPRYNPRKPSMLLAHGWFQSAEDEVIVKIIRAIFDTDLHQKMNIFVLHTPCFMNPTINNADYWHSAKKVVDVGTIVGEMFRKAVQEGLIKPEQINLVGLSLGAHVCGYIGRAVSSQVNSIVGLDPAGPGFDVGFRFFTKLQHVSKMDARFVHLYHTNSAGFGTLQRVGTVDFDFNVGPVQPGCATDIDPKCSHKRAFFIFIDVIRGSGSLIALRCGSLWDFEICHCRGNATLALQYPINISAEGIYFLKTSHQSPFGLGAEGTMCWKDQWDILQQKLEEEKKKGYLAVISFKERISRNLEPLRKKQRHLMNMKPNFLRDTFEPNDSSNELVRK